MHRIRFSIFALMLVTLIGALIMFEWRRAVRPPPRIDHQEAMMIAEQYRLAQFDGLASYWTLSDLEPVRFPNNRSGWKATFSKELLYIGDHGHTHHDIEIMMDGTIRAPSYHSLTQELKCTN